MPKGVKKRGTKKFKNVNRVKALKKKQDKKKLSRSTVKVIKKAWDSTKTARTNIQEMGLAFDPNETIPIRQPARPYIDPVSYEDEAQMGTEIVHVKPPKTRIKPTKTDVVEKMEEEIRSLEEKRAAEDRVQGQSDRDTQLCIYLDERYGGDFKAAARDPRNLFQYTPKQIEKKMKLYKKSAYYKVLTGE
ncbi:hypothetical protein WR25_01650 isoform A [Diploscapter pachys]|uniref:Nucleolar protein 16 n=1 Tax=Diploscapter pachys TaxID=2018661 RepID=A0A2A2JSK9_9BILA|nr:hypothetical protein WR25_01650 isoform A [Diploscapter pachys]